MGIYYFAVLRPQAERRAMQQAAHAEQSQTAENVAHTAQSLQGPTFVTDRSQALSSAARVPIQSGTLKGSLSLQGGRIDDLFLTDYREVQDKPQPVELFRPQGMQNAYFAQFGWTGPNVARRRAWPEHGMAPDQWFDPDADHADHPDLGQWSGSALHPRHVGR